MADFWWLGSEQGSLFEYVPKLKSPINSTKWCPISVSGFDCSLFLPDGSLSFSGDFSFIFFTAALPSDHNMTID